MRDYDQQIERMCETDGVRMASGQHINQPTTDTTCGCWIGRRGNLIWRCDQHFGVDEADFWAEREEVNR